MKKGETVGRLDAVRKQLRVSLEHDSPSPDPARLDGRAELQEADGASGSRRQTDAFPDFRDCNQNFGLLGTQTADTEAALARNQATKPTDDANAVFYCAISYLANLPH